MSRSLLKWEMAGAAFIFIAGTLLHFTFEWSGRLAIVGIFSAVNESVWEHLKLAFWPALLYAIVGYFVFHNCFPNYIFAKSTGILLMPIIIVALHYTYKAILGQHYLVLDITIFAIAIVIGQYVGYKLTMVHRQLTWGNAAGITIMILLSLLFIVFTFSNGTRGQVLCPIFGTEGQVVCPTFGTRGQVLCLSYVHENISLSHL